MVFTQLVKRFVPAVVVTAEVLVVGVEETVMATMVVVSGSDIDRDTVVVRVAARKAGGQAVRRTETYTDGQTYGQGGRPADRLAGMKARRKASRRMDGQTL